MASDAEKAEKLLRGSVASDYVTKGLPYLADVLSLDMPLEKQEGYTYGSLLPISKSPEGKHRIDFLRAGPLQGLTEAYRKLVDGEPMTPDVGMEAGLGMMTSAMPFGPKSAGGTFASGLPRLMTLFSGGGTYEQALKGKVKPVAAVEFNPDIGAHYKTVHGDHVSIDDVRNIDFTKMRGEVDILHASPVCKNYSGAKCAAGETPLDMMTAEATARALKDVEPRVFTLENVPAYQNKEALKIITNRLDELGYKWSIESYDAAALGSPSRRERIMLRASREDLPPSAPITQQKSDWYSAVQDLLPDMKQSQLAPWQRERLAAQGVDIANLDRPLIVGGGSGFRGQVPHAYAGEPSFPIKATANEFGSDRIVMPDGTTYTLNPRAYARLMGLPDDYPLPESGRLAKTIVGNGMAPAMTQHVLNPILEKFFPK